MEEIKKDTQKTDTGIVKKLIFNSKSLGDTLEIYLLINKSGRSKEVKVNNPTVVSIESAQEGQSTLDVNGIPRETKRGKDFELERGEIFSLYGKMTVKVTTKKESKWFRFLKKLRKGLHI